MIKSRKYLSFIIITFVATIFFLAITGCSKNTIQDDTVTPNDVESVNNENTQITENQEIEPNNPPEPVPIAASVCGNDKLESGEECDGSVPKDVTCESKGYDAGDVSCSNDCTIDFSSCTTNTKTSVSTGACVDTDDGMDYTVKGTVTITNDDGSTREYTDYCRHGSSEGQVFEYYCENDKVASESYECPKGCNNNGACYP